MWAFVWLLQGLVASAAGVYLNSPCIRSLLRCAPFQLSLSDGKFSNAFIEDATTLNRQCRSIGPLLECMQEAVLRQCRLNISPAEKEFVKTRLFIAEICKDVDYTQKVYLRNAACINRERDWVIQACNPYDYVQLVNTSNLISLEGSCLFQKMLINCRQEAIHDKCGPDAADLYQRVKAVDMNLDFLCLETRDLRSPKFMLDVVINSYISLLLETLRPVLIMESSYLKDIVEVRQEETTLTSTKVNVPLKRAKMPAHYVQDIAEYKWRRFGDIAIETSTESSSDESSIDSADEEYLPVPIVATVPVSTNMDPARDLDTVAIDTVNIEVGADSRLATVEETSSNFDGIIETTGLDLDGHLSTESIDVEEEAISESAEHLNSAGSEFEQAHLNSGSSNTKVILGIHIPQFDHAEVDAILNTDVVSEAIGVDLGTIQGAIVHEPSDLETSTGFEEFQGMSTLCPEYLETTVTDDVEDALETTTQYPGDHEAPADLGNVQNAALHSGDPEASSANLKDVLETSTLYSDDLETTTDDSDSLQKTTTLLYFSDYFNDAAAESDALGKETRSELDDNEEHIFDTSLPPEITRANFGEESESSSPHSIISHLKGVDDFLSKDVKDLVEDDSLKFKEFLGNLAEIAQSGEFKTPEGLGKVMSIIVSGMYKYILVLSSKPGWESFGNETKKWVELYMHLKNYTADARKMLQAIGTEASVVEKPTSKDLKRTTAENRSLEDLERRGRILEERIHLEAVSMDTVNIEAGADSRLATVEETSSNFDGIIETTGLDFNGHPSTESIGVEEEAISDSAEHLNSAESEFEQAHLNSGNSNTKVILGIHIPQFDHAEVDATLDTNVVSEAIGTDLGTIQATTMHEPSDHETSTDFDEFQGIATLCPEYLETTVTDDVEDSQETTTQYPGDHETSADLDNVQETSTLYSGNLETTTDYLDSLQKTTTLLYSSDYFNDAAAESDALGKETRSELDDNEHIFDTSLPPEITRANFGEKSESSSPHSIISHLKGVDDFLSKDVKDLVEDDSLKFKEFLGNLAEIAQSGEFKTPEGLAKVMSIIVSGMYKYILVLSSKPGWESFGNETKKWVDLYMHLKNYTADARKMLQSIGTDASVVEKPTSKDLERSTAESGSREDLERGVILEERIQEPRDFEKELGGYVSSTVVSGVIDVLGTIFAPKKIERRSVGISRYYIKSISPEEAEGLIHMDLPGVEFVKALVNAWDHAVDAETERLKGSKGHEKNAKFPEEPVTARTTIKSIAELGVKLNYVLIGESYVPLEVGYFEGNEERKSNRNLKIPRRKFKFYTSTPTEPSTQLQDDSEFSTTEYPPETSTDEPESFSELDSNGKFPSDFSCPEVTGNQTPRISHLVDPERRSRLEDCFGVLREGAQSEELPDENPKETDQEEIRRSGDIKGIPERADPRNLDMETMVALRFYAEVLTELASMLPSDSPDSKTLAKRASALVDFGNYLKTKMDPPGIVPPVDKSRPGRIFQKRSLRAECTDQEKPVDGECKKLKTDDGVRFDIGYSPESYIRLEMSYPAVTGMEDAYGVPVAKYIMMGETRLPLELHFTYKNVNYVHYAKIDIPKRSVDLKDHIALDEF